MEVQIGENYEKGKRGTLALIVECREGSDKARGGKYYIPIRSELMKRLLLKTLSDGLVRLAPNEDTGKMDSSDMGIVSDVLGASRDIELLSVDPDNSKTVFYLEMYS